MARRLEQLVVEVVPSLLAEAVGIPVAVASA